MAVPTTTSVALSPIRDTLIEGFSHFVTSMTVPIASGWSRCRVGLAPTGKRRLVTAHTHLRPTLRAKGEHVSLTVLATALGGIVWTTSGQGELKHRTARYVRACPQASAVIFDDLPAN